MDAAISEEKAEAFQSCCNERFGAGVTLNPLNLIDSGRFEVKQSYLLETRVIDGRKYLTILVEEEIEGQRLRCPHPGRKARLNVR